MLILEVTLRIINADNIIDENEVRFLNLIRSKLDVADKIISERFGKISYLKNLNYEEIQINESNLINEINITDIKNWEDVNLT